MNVLVHATIQLFQSHFFWLPLVILWIQGTYHQSLKKKSQVSRLGQKVLYGVMISLTLYVHLDIETGNELSAGMKPVTQTEEQLVVMGVLPLLLAGVLSAPTVPHDILQLYLKDLVLQSTAKYGAWRPSHTQDLIDAVRFLW